MAAFDTTEFLNKVKLKATLPEGRYEDSEILGIAKDMLMSVVVPTILGLKEEYYVTSESQDITANQGAYPIPYRAFGLSLREVKRLYSNQVQDLARIDPTDIRTTATGTPHSFYLEGQDVVLYPTPQATEGTLKLSYYLTPSAPVLVTETAPITNIDRNTGIITATPPTAWTTGNSFDFVSQRNGHKTLAFDLTATNVSTSTITFTASDIPSSLLVGDSIALAGEAPYLQAPDSAFPMLVQIVANELLEDMGDTTALQLGQAKAEQLRAAFVSSLSVRVQGAPKRSVIRI
jgi:hypothetical protein